MVDWKREWKKLAGIVAVFAAFFWLPMGWQRFTGGAMEALHLAKWYAREHVLLCLVPAFFIAGAISVFVGQASVMRYLGAKANKILAYGVASISGTILAVCSCTVLPLFAGIYRMGAGIGPATAFLYSGPAINVLAVILTARILGLELGIARAIGAVAFSIIIGLAMHLIYRKEELEKANDQVHMPQAEVSRPLWQNAMFFFVMVGVLVFSNWGAPNDFQFRLNDGREFTAAVTRAPEDVSAEGAVLRVKMLSGPQAGKEIDIAASGIADQVPIPSAWATIWAGKWIVVSVFAVGLALVLILWFAVAWWKIVMVGIPPAVLALALPAGSLWVLVPFSVAIVGFSAILSTNKGEGGQWFAQSWGFAKQILPLLLIGVLLAGFLLGRPGHQGIIPNDYVQMLVGDSPDRMLEITGWGGGSFEGFARAVWPIWTNLFAGIFGAFMYFATLTEVPILQGLIGAGMGKGPALALLLAGPALSLPNMLVIRSVMGTRKTLVFVSLVVAMATISGMLFGWLF